MNEEQVKENIYLLDGDFFVEERNLREMILKLRLTKPTYRIVFIQNKENLKLKMFLYHWCVFDVIEEKIKEEELKHLINHPREFKDISHQLENSHLEQMQRIN